MKGLKSERKSTIRMIK